MTFIVYEPLSAEHDTFESTKVIDFVEAESYSYIKHRYSIGTFTLVVPNSVHGLKLIQKDMLLLVLDEYVNDSLIITSVKDDGLHTTIRGHDCKLMLKWRVTLFPPEEIEAGTYGYDVATGSTGEIIQHYIEYNAGGDSETERQIYGLVCSELSGGLDEDTYMSRMQPLNEVIEALCINADIGYSIDIVRSGEKIGYVVTVSEGTDRTNGQSENSKMVFADYTFSADSITVETNADERKNLIWAINGGTVDDAVVTAVNNSDEEEQPEGFARRETVTTVNCDPDDVEIYAKKDVEGCTDKTEITVEAAIYSDYGTKYFVGDLVTVMKNGTAYDKRILSAEKSYSGQSKRVMITLGDVPEKRIMERLNYETAKNRSETITQRLDGPSGGSGSGTGIFLDSGHTSVAHNDVEHNTSTCKYDSISGYKNSSSGTSSTVNDIVYSGANTIIGEHNKLTNGTAMFVHGKENTVTNAGYSDVGGDGNTVQALNAGTVNGNGNNVTNVGYSTICGSNISVEYVGEAGIFGKDHAITGDEYCRGLFVSGVGAAVTGHSLMFVVANSGNIFTIDTSGNVLAAGSYGTIGSDYAEYFEWVDGNPDNEDRCGLLVSLRGDRIVPAHGDDILGAISGRASVIGNAFESYWHGKYKTDVYGHILTDEHGKKIISPEYDPNREYIPRSERGEWSVVGLVGRLIVRDNGKCAVGGYVSARNGTAVPTTKRTGIIVLKRVDEAHVEVLIK